MLKTLSKMLPDKTIHVEPFGDIAPLLCLREPARNEVYNDMGGGLVGFFRAMATFNGPTIHAPEVVVKQLQLMYPNIMSSGELVAVDVADEFNGWRDRFMRVQIDEIPVLNCIKYWDSEDTLFCIWPPPMEQDSMTRWSLYRMILKTKGAVALDFRFIKDDQCRQSLLKSKGWKQLSGAWVNPQFGDGNEG